MNKLLINVTIFLSFLLPDITYAQSQWLNNSNGIHYPIGKVGIGTNNPLEGLDVMGYGRFNNYLDKSQTIKIGHDGAHGIIDGSHDLLINYYSGKNVVIGNASTGNLGIGIGNSNSRLVVSDNGTNYLKFYGNSSGDISASGSFRPHFANGDFSVYEGIPGTSKLRFSIFANSGNTILAPTTGNVGIGTINPTLMDYNSGYAAALDLSKILHMKGDDPTIRLQDIVVNSGSPSKTDFIIQSSNGAGRLISDGTIAFFIDANNKYLDNNVNYGNAQFRVFKNASYFGGAAANLLRLEQDGTFTINGNSRENFKVDANGKAWAREFEITLNSFPDYVFKRGYNLMPLNVLEKYIQTNSHLPNVPTEKEITNNGLNVGNLIKIQMEKIEELTLYIIQLEKRIKILETK